MYFNFISYSREDSDFVVEFSNRLKESGCDVWIDWKGIPATAKWMDEIYSAIVQSDTFIFIVTPNSVTSPICLAELNYAADLHKKIIPILHLPVDQDLVPASIRMLQWVEFHKYDFERAIKIVDNAIRTNLEWNREHTRLGLKANDWHNRKFDKSYLLQKNDLKLAEIWIRKASPDNPQPTLAHVQYIHASRREANYHLLRFFCSVIIGALVITGISWLTYEKYREVIVQKERANNEGRLSLSRQLASQSLHQLEDNYDLALILSLEANRIAPTVEAEGSLLTSLEYSPQVETYIRPDTKWVTCIATHPHKPIMAIPTSDASVEFWNFSTGKREHGRLSYNIGLGQILSLDYNPDGNILVAGTHCGVIILWDVVSFKTICPPLFKHKHRVNNVAFHPDGNMFASTSNDGTIIMWDVKKQTMIGKPLTQHNSFVKGISFSPDGKRMVSGSNNEIFLWNLNGIPTVTHTYKTQNSSIMSVAFSSDGRLVAVGGSGTEGDITLLDGRDLTPKGPPVLAHKREVNTLAFNSAGTILASGGGEGTICFWNPQTLQLIGRKYTEHRSSVTGIDFSPDGSMLASTSMDGSVILRNVGVEYRLGTILDTVENGLDHIHFTLDGNRLVGVGEGRKIYIWNMETHKLEYNPIELEKGSVRSFELSPDRSVLATIGFIGNGFSNRVMTLDLNNPSNIVVFDSMRTRKISCLTFSPDGKYLFTGSKDSMVLCWNLITGQCEGKPYTVGEGEISAIGFLPDGRLFASVSGMKGAITWDITNRSQSIQTLPMNGSFVYTYNCDSSLMAISQENNSIIIWDIIQNKTKGMVLTGHKFGIGSLAFRLDDNLLVSSDSYGMMLWDLKTYTRIGQPFGGTVSNLVFSPTEKILASCGSFDDPRVILWNMDIESWKEIACYTANRNMTKEEWQCYVGSLPYHITCRIYR